MRSKAAHTAAEEGDYFVYSTRWLMAVLFLISGMANAMVLLTWSPISDLADQFWGNIGTTAVNLLTVLFQIVYIPGTLLALYISEKYNLRTILLTGGFLTTLGCVIRFFGGFGGEKQWFSPLASYIVVLLGTLLVALSQPFYLNMPAKLAAAWFNIRERDLSTTFCSMANPLGSALGSAVPAYFVTSSASSTSSAENAAGEGSVTGVGNLLLMQLCVSGFALFLTIIFFTSHPPSPPSLSAARALAAAMGSNGASVDSGVGSRSSNIGGRAIAGRSMFNEAKRLWANTEYLKLLIAFSVGLGNLNALAALLNQLPGGYTNSEVGFTGFALILSGFLGAFLTGFLLEKTKAYRTIAKGAYTLSFVFWVVFASSCRLGVFGFFITSGGLLGLTLLPIIPATIVNAVECAHPVAEDLSVGILYIGANTLAVAMTFSGQALLELSEGSLGPRPLYPWAVFSTGTMAVGLVVVLFFRGQYLRLEQDTATARLLPGGPGSQQGPEDGDDPEGFRKLSFRTNSEFLS